MLLLTKANLLKLQIEVMKAERQEDIIDTEEYEKQMWVLCQMSDETMDYLYEQHITNLEITEEEFNDGDY